MIPLKIICRQMMRRELYCRRYVSKDKQSILIPHVDDTVFENLEKGTMTVKGHPGRTRPGFYQLDEELIQTINTLLGDSVYKILLHDAKTYYNYVRCRQPPVTRAELMDKSAVCYWEIYNKSKVDFDELSAAQYEEEEDIIKTNANKLVKSRIFPWMPINYTKYVAKQYLVTRMAPECAALNRVFLEIVNRCPSFKPHSLFDLCSGIGAVTYVARSFWKDSLEEYYNVDLSADMHEMARLVLTKGDPEAELPFKNVYYRQFMPSKAQRKYSLTVCSYSLLEFATSESRLQTLLKLWNKTEDFMVLIEHGNTTGYRLLMEARDFILQTDQASNNPTGVHVFAPCSHDMTCPLPTIKGKTCRFKVPYERLPIGQTRLSVPEYFSYVILRKGPRPENDEQWPRMIRPPRKKKGVTTCFLCTKEGKLCDFTFRKKRHGVIYHTLSRGVECGDRLPIQFSSCDLSDYIDYSDDVDVKEITNSEDIPEFDSDSD